MTEQDAKKRWCPMVRGLPVGNNEIYRHATTRDWGDEESNCIASKCMMWVEDFLIQNNEGIIVNVDSGGHCGLIR
jgi:hypothetical protein